MKKSLSTLINSILQSASLRYTRTKIRYITHYYDSDRYTIKVDTDSNTGEVDYITITRKE